MPRTNGTSHPPARLGYRMPAEWEPHAATWIAWPHNQRDWPGKFAAIPWAFAEIVRKLTLGERVRILVHSAAHEARADEMLSRVGVDRAQVEFFRFATDRAWTRDFGPLFVVRRGGAKPARGRGHSRAIAGFRFNAWARYSNWERDARIPARAAKALRVPFYPARIDGQDVVLEGGAIDVNGRGSILVTEECLLSKSVQARNPGLGRAELERVFAENLGVTNVLWLGKGLAGDDTHGHIDDLARFVDPRTIVICQEKNRRDVNFRALKENRERLRSMRLEDGSRPQVVELPLPAPVVFHGQRLPASYANFYISNACVLVPTFNDPNDRIALGTLSELFPKRTVVGIHAVDLVWGYGTIHCLTQQEPRA